MRFDLLAALALPALVSGLAIHPRQSNSTPCTNPVVRREWRQLSVDERAAYVDAVTCLTNKPSVLDQGSSRHDDFPRVHGSLQNSIHYVAGFLPWHRYLLHLYEKALREECGYGGHAVYWDWSLDAADPAGSPVWDPETGFGGDGDPNRVERFGGVDLRCVNDGPFSQVRPSFWNGARRPHCLSRNFNNGNFESGSMMNQVYTPEVLADIMSETDFESFGTRAERTPHDAVHNAVGGDMAPSTAPSDPIFYLHHGQLDRMWGLWQQQDRASRTFEYAGPREQVPVGGLGPEPPEATLDDVMPVFGLGPDIPVRDVMDTQGGLLCYTYE